MTDLNCYVIHPFVTYACFADRRDLQAKMASNRRSDAKMVLREERQ